jgi:uncharacterized protein (DUF58 family)
LITPRAFVLALICPALLVLSLFVPILAAVGVVYGLAILALLIVDRQRAGKVSQFTITRQHDEKLSLGVLNRIVLRVRSSAARPVAFTVRDEAPALFAGGEDATRSAVIQARDTVDLDYAVRPLRRGDFRFGSLNVRWDGPLGLYRRQAVIPAEHNVKVYPDLHGIRKYDMLLRRDRVAEMGLRNVRLRGEGTAFESLRDYTPDDPYRSINWKATARRAKPISTDYEPERSQRVMILLDVGRMMRSPVRVDDPSGESWNMAKVDFVINSVMLFAYVATLKGDQVGLLVFADRVKQYIPPAAGRDHFHKLLEAMYALESEPVEADYRRAINYLNVQNKKRSLSVMFTDLSGARASEMLLAYLPRLAPRHVPLLVTIRDPALDQEASQPPEDSEAVYRRAVAEQLLDERRLLLDNLQRRGVLTIDVAPEKLTMAVVNRYLQLKARVLA